jgi:DNA-binding CsgD family transcriptional regulator
VERISDPILIVDKETRTILGCNRRLEFFLCWDRHELIGQSAALIHEDDRAFVEFGSAKHQRDISSDVFLGLWRLKRGDRSIVPCEVTMLDFCRTVAGRQLILYIFRDRSREEEHELELVRIARETLELARRLSAITGSSDEAREGGELMPTLSRRQREIVDMVARGLSSKEIAACLGLTQMTIRNHLTILFRKFGVSSRIALMNALRERGLLIR